MLECMKMENHSNVPASAIEGLWNSAGTFTLAMRQTSFDSIHHAVHSLLATYHPRRCRLNLCLLVAPELYDRPVAFTLLTSLESITPFNMKYLHTT
jgi:hypothetical protein